MTLPKLMRPLAGAALAGMVFLGAPMAAPAAPAPPAPAPQQNVRVVTYDASQAAEFKEVVDQGAQIWNDSVQNVKLEPGSPADVTVLADDGWPRAMVEDLGVGTIWMGRQAVNEGHEPVRISAHELGHILGLPDRRTGICEELMSGASAGPDCDNANPNAAEIAEVEELFAGSASLEPKLYTEDLNALLAG